MARDYTANNSSHVFSAFGFKLENESGKSNAPFHIAILLRTWIAEIAELRTVTNGDNQKTQSLLGVQSTVEFANSWQVNKKEFVYDAIVDSFHKFERYGYNFEFAAPQSVTVNSNQSHPIVYTYHKLTITGDGIVESPTVKVWAFEDVGTDAFAVEFKRVVGMELPASTPNSVIWAFYQSTMAKIAELSPVKRTRDNSVNAILAYSNDGDWLLKIIANSPEEICKDWYLSRTKTG